MPFSANSWLRNAIWRSSGGLLSALVLALVFGLLVGTRSQAQLSPGNAPGNAQPAALQAANPNAAAAQNPVAAQGAVQSTAPIAEPVLRQNLIQDQFRVAIDNAIQKGKQEAAANAVAKTTATQTTPVATGTAAQNNSQNASPNTSPNTTPNTSPNATPNTTPNANRQPNPNQPAAAPTGPIPPLINAGIQSMVSARASLENAGNKWGGHKQTAIKLIDQALTACGQTAAPRNAEAKPNPAGDTAAMEAALTQLTAAQKHFTSAINPWGGRRDQALALINQALSEVQAAIAFSKSHNTY